MPRIPGPLAPLVRFASVRMAGSAGTAARDRGFALVAVLWFLILLAFLASSFSASSRTSGYLARNLEESSQAEGLADAGVYRALWELMQFSTEPTLRTDGTVYGWAFDGGTVRFSLQGEDGKIDLNAAPQALIEQLFLAVGVGGEDATALAAAIADYRDEDDDPHPAGAEASAYAAAGLPPPKNEPFQWVDEVRQVLGMTNVVFERVQPSLTVYTGASIPLIDVAPPDVRTALQNTDEDLLAEQGYQPQPGGDPDDPDWRRPGLDTGSGWGRGSSSGLGGYGTDVASTPGGPFSVVEPGRMGASDGLSGASAPGVGSGTAESAALVGALLTAQILTIHAEGRTTSGAVFARDAVVELGSGEKPYRFFLWRQGNRRYFPLEPS